MGESQDRTTPEGDPTTIAQAYLEAFGQRDLERCVGYFADDATIAWIGGVYQGEAAIKQWHGDRFAANLRVVRVDAIQAEDKTVTVDAVVDSDRLKAWRISSLGGRVTLTFGEDGKINRTAFGLRFTNPLQQ
jgi:hypothetical protein